MGKVGKFRFSHVARCSYLPKPRDGSVALRAPHELVAVVVGALRVGRERDVAREACRYRNRNIQV